MALVLFVGSIAAAAFGVWWLAFMLFAAAVMIGAAERLGDGGSR